MQQTRRAIAAYILARCVGAPGHRSPQVRSLSGTLHCHYPLIDEVARESSAGNAPTAGDRSILKSNQPFAPPFLDRHDDGLPTHRRFSAESAASAPSLAAFLWVLLCVATTGTNRGCFLACS